MKYLRITMPDNSKWDVEAVIIANSRAAYYAQKDSGVTEGREYDKIYKDEMEYALSDSDELIDWAENNMNWEDVQRYAHKVKDGNIDYQEGWVNGEKEVIEV